MENVEQFGQNPLERSESMCCFWAVFFHHKICAPPNLPALPQCSCVLKTIRSVEPLGPSYAPSALSFFVQCIDLSILTTQFCTPPNLPDPPPMCPEDHWIGSTPVPLCPSHALLPFPFSLQWGPGPRPASRSSSSTAVWLIGGEEGGGGTRWGSPPTVFPPRSRTHRSGPLWSLEHQPLFNVTSLLAIIHSTI